MVAYSVIMYNCSGKEKPVAVASAFDLGLFGLLKRSTVKEFLSFASREVAARTRGGERQSVKHQMDENVSLPQGVSNNFVCHCSVSLAKLGCVLISDGEYPIRVAYDFIKKAQDEMMKVYADKVFTLTSDTNLKISMIENEFSKYQKPEDMDSFTKLQKEIDDTKGVLIQTMDKLLQRGEKLDDLVQKSQDLSFHSKAFMKKSKELQRCCTII